MYPYYINMGMSYEEFWERDPVLAVDYRKAQEMAQKSENEHMWWQGMYIYEALCCVSPLLHAFAKKGTKAHPYASEPYPRTVKEQAERKAREERKAIENGIKKMKMFAAQFNKRFENQEGK